MVFRHLLAEVVKKEEALRVVITEVGTLQALLDIERQGYTSSPSMEKELVCFDTHMVNLERLLEI